MTKTITLSAIFLLAAAPVAFAGGHNQVAADMVEEIQGEKVVGKGRSAASAASALKGGWGNRNDSITGGTLGPAQVSGKPRTATLK